MSNPAPAIVVAALYKFVAMDDLGRVRADLVAACTRAGVRGTLLLAPEGINGTIAGSRDAVLEMLAHIRSLPGLSDIEWKESRAETMPFKRMKVRLKREVVTMGVPDLEPAKSRGIYVAPGDWNALITDPGVVVIDTRNDYEVALGTFQGATNPNIRAFTDFPDWLAANLDRLAHAKVAMFCTGGIRCEKATALLKEKGCHEVYHLQGGILKYLEEVSADASLWQGQCFVFDERVSVGHGLVPGPHQLCPACRQPVETGREKGGYAREICPACATNAPEPLKAAVRERQRQRELAEMRGASHFGPPTASTE